MKKGTIFDYGFFIAVILAMTYLRGLQIDEVIPDKGIFPAVPILIYCAYICLKYLVIYVSIKIHQRRCDKLMEERNEK